MIGRLFAKADFDKDSPVYDPSETEFVSESEANLETSIAASQSNPHVVMHRPVIDLDVPHEYRESSTPGHAHLLLDIDIPWEKYLQWLELSAELGIVQSGWVKASKVRRFTSIRKKGVKKTKKQKENSNYNSYPEPIAVSGTGSAAVSMGKHWYDPFSLPPF